MMNYTKLTQRYYAGLAASAFASLFSSSSSPFFLHQIIIIQCLLHRFRQSCPRFQHDLSLVRKIVRGIDHLCDDR